MANCMHIVVAFVVVLATCVDICTSSPLAGTGYTSQHDNYLCETPFGGETFGADYKLPCVAPRDDWVSQFKSKFVITAWW